MDRPSLRERRGWPGWAEALRHAHSPAAEADLSPADPARERLAYDEVFASQLAVALVRARRQRRRGRVIVGSGRLAAKVEAGLGFALTGAQRLAIAEIGGEMAQTRRMMRLLQGDVGSGKTVVALMAMLTAVESGAQAALMAPTEILARQHQATLRRLAAPAGVEIGLLTGREKGRARDATLAGLASGLIADRRRDPRAVAAGCRLSRPRPGGHRRAAPLWRRAAPGARREGPRRRHPADDARRRSRAP